MSNNHKYKRKKHTSQVKPNVPMGVNKIFAGSNGH